MQRVINYCQEWRSILYSQCVGFIWNRFGSSARSAITSVVIVGVEAGLGKSDVVEMVIYQLA